MNNNEFTLWLKGFIDAIDKVPTEKQWGIIINKLNQVNTYVNNIPIKKTVDVLGTLEKTKLRYGDICSCNPNNGGSGICGCTIANKFINNDSINTTNFQLTDNSHQQYIS